mgnify:CR=1 FL=1
MEKMSSIDGERFTSQVISFLNEQWGLFCDGDEEVKGEMLGQFVGEVILAAFLPAKTLKGLPGIAPQMKIGRLLNSIAKQGKNLSDNVAKLFYNVTEMVGKRPSVVLDVMDSVGKLGFKNKNTVKSFAELTKKVTNINDIKHLEKMVDTSKLASRGTLNYGHPQLQKKLVKHGKDFGIEQVDNAGNLTKFKGAVDAHVKSDKVIPIKGTYRGNIEVTHYYDPSKNLNVIMKPNGDFVSGWKLGKEQVENLIRTGNIQ